MKQLGNEKNCEYLFCNIDILTQQLPIDISCLSEKSKKILTIINSFVSIFEYAAQGGRSMSMGITELGE